MTPARREAPQGDGELGLLREQLAAAVEQLQAAQRGLDEGSAELDAARESAEVERQRSNLAFELAPDPYLVCDASGAVVEANRAAARLFGIPGRPPVGVPLSRVVAGDEAELRRSLLGLRTRERVDFETVLRSREGDAIEAAVTASAIRRGGGIDGVLLLVRDVTALKRVQAQQLELASELERRVVERTHEGELERARLEEVLRQLPAAVVIADAADGRIVLANEAAEGLAARPLRGAAAADVAAAVAATAGGTALAGEASALVRALRTGAAVVDEVAEVGPREARRTISMSAAPVRDSAGAVVAAVSVWVDVTERERRERAEREFVVNAAHELRTPAAAIASAIEVLQGGAKEEPEERDRFLSHIERESARLSRLAASLLTLARVQSGALARLELVELRPLLQRVAGGLTPAPGVSVRVRGSRSAVALAHEAVLEQAVENVARNAAAHTGRGFVELRAHVRGGDAVVTVADSGPGIPPEVRDRIFERFYRSPGDPEGGFGLGLAIARQAVEALGGRVELDETPGGGATFRLVLPREGG